MINLLGPPPKELLDRARFAEKFFDEHGRRPVADYTLADSRLHIPGSFVPDFEVPRTSLEEEEENLEGEEQSSFLRFIRRMLQWLPEDRKSAKELLEDPWLHDS